MAQVDFNVADVINWLHHHEACELTYRESHEAYCALLAYAKRTFPETFGHTRLPDSEVLMLLLREFRKLEAGIAPDLFVRQWVDKRDVVPLQPIESAATYY